MLVTRRPDRGAATQDCAATPLLVQLARRCEPRVHLSIESDRDRLPGLPPTCSLRRDDGRDLREQLAAEKGALGCQTAAIVIREPQALPAKLLFQETVLFTE